jgi:hypothetical protein
MKQAAETNIPTWRAGTNLGNKVVLSSDFEIIHRNKNRADIIMSVFKKQ